MKPDAPAPSAHSLLGACAWLLATSLCWGCAHTVEVRTDPPGALISVNGNEIGVAPVRFEEELDPSVEEYEITARLNGHETTVKRLRRSQANPVSTVAVTPCCGTLGWLAGGASFLAGVLLGIPTLGCALLPGTALAALFVGTGCGWMLVTSPTLLLLRQAQTLPDEVNISLAPSGTFEQHDTEASPWPPQLIWSPEEDVYWQNPAPEQANERAPPPEQEPRSAPAMPDAAP
jgi:hypothetical protein